MYIGRSDLYEINLAKHMQDEEVVNRCKGGSLNQCVTMDGNVAYRWVGNNYFHSRFLLLQKHTRTLKTIKHNEDIQFSLKKASELHGKHVQ